MQQLHNKASLHKTHQVAHHSHVQVVKAAITKAVTSSSQGGQRTGYQGPIRMADVLAVKAPAKADNVTGYQGSNPGGQRPAGKVTVKADNVQVTKAPIQAVNVQQVEAAGGYNSSRPAAKATAKSSRSRRSATHE